MQPHKQQVQEILANITGFRTDASKDFASPDQNVIFMLGHMVRMVAGGCQAEFWPELMDANSNGPEDRLQLHKEVAEVHKTVIKFIGWINNTFPAPNEMVPSTILEALEEVKWSELTQRGRQVYCSQMGLYLLSRFWVLGKTMHLLGSTPTRPFEMVCEVAAQVMRNEDQKTSPRSDANAALQAAVQFADRCGMSVDDIRKQVEVAFTQLSEDASVSDGLSRASSFNE